MERITESTSLYRHIDQKSIREILEDINQEDQKVAIAVKAAIPQIEALSDAVWKAMSEGGRLYYIGAGTSGRLGIVDASECPPTYGVPHDWVVGIIAGGDGAIRKAVEFAEDDTALAWKDLQSHGLQAGDVVVGIAASGTTPYVVHGLEACRNQGIATGCITCNTGSPMAAVADYPVEVVVGPEYITGSTRMKSGTAQKLVLNMLTTSVMVKLGRVVDNRMVDMQLSNNKLVDRGAKMLMQQTTLTYDASKHLLLKHGSVRAGVEAYKQKK